MRVLVTGASGLAGRKVAELAVARGHDVYSAHREHPVEVGTPVRLDLLQTEAVARAVRELKPDTVIHAAAYTDVDGCEVNRELAWRLNVEATVALARASAAVGAHVIYVSTDYVFDGERGLYGEGNLPNPVNYYGLTKLAGEAAVLAAGDFAVARTSAVFGWGREWRPNFALYVLEVLRRGVEVKAAVDQFVSPTFNANLADMLLELAERGLGGVWHIAGATRTSRHQFAVEVAKAFGLDASLVKPATAAELRWVARRPRDSSLDVSKALSSLNTRPMTLGEALKAMLRDSPLRASP